jgi:imidazolonepropionase-like amidohydrolase
MGDESQERAYLADRVFTGLEDSALEGRAVWVRGDRVHALLAAGELPAHVPVERLPGATLMPGLIDAHVHLQSPGDGSTQATMEEPDDVLAAAASAHARTALAGGITTVRDCGSRRQSVMAARRAIALGWAEGSHIWAAGAPLTVPKGHGWPSGGEVSGNAGVRAGVRAQRAIGADFIKVINSGGGTPGTYSWQAAFPTEELAAIVEEAHGLGMRVTVHCLCTEAMKRVLAAGADHIEHGQFLVEGDRVEVDGETADAIAAAGVAITPTLVVAASLLARMDPDGDPALRDRWHRMLDGWLEGTRRMYKAGVRLVTGTDAGWRYVHFDDVAWEVELLQAVGMHSAESLRAATSEAARVLGLDEIGSLEAGQRADMVAFDGDPLRDPAALRRPVRVLKAGRAVAGIASSSDADHR